MRTTRTLTLARRSSLALVAVVASLAVGTGAAVAATEATHASAANSNIVVRVWQQKAALHAHQRA